MIYAAPDNGRGPPPSAWRSGYCYSAGSADACSNCSLARIKAKKIPIVQPKFNFSESEKPIKNFIDIFQYDTETQKATHCLLVNGIFLVL
ncbi:hypothetical protein QA648_09415 [Rhizobium sp. CB3171]|uniref:hypothetical protein n=1 Tax=Rhizobium sp. CB3171 TaxID=3039157 RepID=UPI0024B0C7EE|nr:hypothetical protein [Rhizobium sp. CB3171]WFU03928.1 hypothetical protein QA648_09415 [Rhizobium sp. CB3171]